MLSSPPIKITRPLQTEAFLSKLQAEMDFIEKHLLARMDNTNSNQFETYKRIFNRIENDIRENSSDPISEVYGSFLHSVKRFKRKCDNQLKFGERDIDAFRKRYEATSKPLIPLIHDIKMNVHERMIKFDLETVKNHNFQMHLYTNKELCDIAFKIMDYSGIYRETTAFKPEEMKALIKTLCLRYNVVPYHNWTHAFSVFHMLFCLYEGSTKFRDFVKPFEFFCAEIAALGHDMNHKGLGNLYKQKRQSTSSLHYCEIGILENMHAAQLFQVLQGNGDTSTNYFAILKDQNKVQQMKRMIVSCITHTDMSKHQKAVGKMQRRVGATLRVEAAQKGETDSSETLKNSTDLLDVTESLKKDNFEDRRFLLNIMMHASDIGNPCLDFTNYMNWSYMITQEFSDQIHKEELHSLPITGFLVYKDKATFLNGQTFFCKAMVLPLWHEIGLLFPELSIYPESIKANLVEIEDRKPKLKSNATSSKLV